MTGASSNGLLVFGVPAFAAMYPFRFDAPACSTVRPALNGSAEFRFVIADPSMTTPDPSASPTISPGFDRCSTVMHAPASVGSSVNTPLFQRQLSHPPFTFVDAPATMPLWFTASAHPVV